MIIKRKEYYIHLYAEEGLVLTKWDKVDIKDYSGAKHAYVHTDEEIEPYYEITEAEHLELLRRQEEEIIPHNEENKSEE